MINSSRRYRTAIVSATGFLLLLAARNSRAVESLRVVALSGNTVPGASAGTLFQGFSALNLNGAGQTAFRATLQQGTGDALAGNNNGVWSEGGGTLALVARQGSQAPNAPTGAVFSSFYTPRLDNEGRISFGAFLLDGSGGVDKTNDDVLYSQLGGPLHAYLRGADPAPGLPAGSQFDGFSLPVVGDGQIAFFAYLKIGPGGAQSNSIGTNWVGDASGIQLVAREGDHAPGTPNGTLFDDMFSPNVNGSGSTAFEAETVGSFAGQHGGVWTKQNGVLSKVAYYGDPAPGTTTVFNSFYRPVINDAGQVAFLAALQGIGVQTGIWTYDSNNLVAVASIGDSAPGITPSAKLSTFSTPVISSSGQITFGATLAPDANVTSSNSSGIFAISGSASRLIARVGNQAPGTSAGDTFASFSFAALTSNSPGQVAFTASLNVGVGDVTSASNRGIWAEDKTGLLRLIARTGDTLDVDNGPGVDLRTIATLTFTDLTGNFGPADTFNDQGQLAFLATFTDGSSGVFVSNVAAVPEPTLASLAAGLLLVGLTRIRRK